MDKLKTDKTPYDTLTEDLERLCAKHGLKCCSFIGFGYSDGQPVSSVQRVEVVKDRVLNWLNGKVYDIMICSVKSFPSAIVLKEEEILKKPTIFPSDEMPH